MRARCPSCDRRFTGEVDRCPFDETPLVRMLEAKPVQEDGDPPLGTLVANQYRLLEIVGEGGMGVIYRARQETVGRDVAVKLLRARFAKEESVVRRFENEARIISQLRHPNTLRLYDTQYMENGSLLIVTEFLEGQSLDELLRNGPIGVERALSIADQICASLSEAHAVGVVHRDLKPANVFLDRVGGEDLVKVLDFGIAKLTQGGMVKTQANIIMGTPAYMAPEQVRGEAADTRSDIYALGVLIYQMLSGHTPFAAENPVTLLMKQLNEAPPPFRRELGISPELDQLVFQMLRKTPAERPERVSEVRDRLRQIARGQGSLEATIQSEELIPLDRPIRRAQEDTPAIPAMKQVSSAVTGTDLFAVPKGSKGTALTIPIEIDGPLESATAPKLSLFLDEGLATHELARRPRRAESSPWPLIVGVLALATAGAGGYLWFDRAAVATARVEPAPTQDPEVLKAAVTPPPAAAPTPIEPPKPSPAPVDGAVAATESPDEEDASAEARGERKKKRKKRAKGQADAVDPLEAATSKLLSGNAAPEGDDSERAEETDPEAKPSGPAPEAQESPPPQAPEPPDEAPPRPPEPAAGESAPPS